MYFPSKKESGFWVRLQWINVAGADVLIGSTLYDSLSQYTDTSSFINPSVTSYRYRISTVDTCGNESELSQVHKTIHLTANLGASGTVNLIWDAYQGFTVSYYRIWRFRYLMAGS